jgi:Cd2+/Zn2+-exporting ATPase
MLACIFLAVSLLHYIGGDFESLRWVALGAVVVGIVPIVRKAFSSLRNGIVDINTLMTVAVVGACTLQDFGEAATVVALFGVSECHWMGLSSKGLLRWMRRLSPARASRCPNLSVARCTAEP